MEAFAPKRLVIMSMQRNETQLSVMPQSSARYGSETSSLLASRFMRTTLSTKSVTFVLGTLRSSSR